KLLDMQDSMAAADQAANQAVDKAADRAADRAVNRAADQSEAAADNTSGKASKLGTAGTDAGNSLGGYGHDGFAHEDSENDIVQGLYSDQKPAKEARQKRSWLASGKERRLKFIHR